MFFFLWSDAFSCFETWIAVLLKMSEQLQIFWSVHSSVGGPVLQHEKCLLTPGLLVNQRVSRQKSWASTATTVRVHILRRPMTQQRWRSNTQICAYVYSHIVRLHIRSRPINRLTGADRTHKLSVSANSVLMAPDGCADSTSRFLNWNYSLWGKIITKNRNRSHLNVFKDSSISFRFVY